MGSLTNPVIEVSPKLKIYFPYQSKNFQLRPDHGTCQRTKNDSFEFFKKDCKDNEFLKFYQYFVPI